MIRVKVYGGGYDGLHELLPEVDPAAFLNEVHARGGADWVIEFSATTSRATQVLWGRADVQIRAYRQFVRINLGEARSITLDGERFTRFDDLDRVMRRLAGDTDALWECDEHGGELRLWVAPPPQAIFLSAEELLAATASEDAELRLTAMEWREAGKGGDAATIKQSERFLLGLLWLLGVVVTSVEWGDLPEWAQVPVLFALGAYPLNAWFQYQRTRRKERRKARESERSG